ASAAAHNHSVAVLEKDFVVDEYQIYQARAAGADTVLLIIAILDPVQYSDLYDVATDIGMEPLVEVFDAAELDVALTNAEPRIVGINNRNLKTLTTSLEVFPALAKRIPDDVVKVAESGMRSANDVKRMADAGAKAVLVGESLMTGDGDPSELISQMATISV
ncbi:MAG: indole-3-glycerol-phosphate synthase, partial [Chloroflexi bacterium]|nr:indole-3-glycerol-phosphate synthase [Chloroflexota bacterium]